MAEVIDLLTRAGLALGVHSTMGLDTHIKRVREDFDAIITERDAAIARAEKAEGEAEKLLNSAEEASMQDAWAKQQQATAERSRDELGIQLAACQERLRLAMAVVEHARAHDHDDVGLAAAIDALDAVPGDVLARDIGPALDRAHEASGVVTGAPFDEPSNGVKGVE
jgi:predicted nuclease with TOPRIM domain